MTAAAAAATALAFLLDAVVAEPPAAVHPVAAFGRLAGACDRRWRRPRAAGFAAALFLPLSAAAIAGATVRVAALTPAPAVVAAVLAGLWLFAATSRRMLLDVSREVLADVRSDTERARESIRALVGRDAAALSPAELRSGVVESAAENLADGLVAPLLAFALGAQVSLSLAAAAAVWVKAVNTLDSMLGYPSKPHGTASARL
ncbi:MAG: cobalamin biosynthesis protein, partial [Salinigranum sp.]